VNNTTRIERKKQTILYVQTADLHDFDEFDRETLSAEIQWLAARHQGTVDRFTECAAVVFFDEPASCVRMAIGLQRNASALRLRMGIYTGMCEIGTFRSGREVACALLGLETGLSAKVAATAAIGSIAISPQTYILVKDEIEGDTAGCLLTEEFQDSDLAQVCLTPTPQRGENNLSTFAGLGS
jgi:class 3 adenylate cyclase